MTVDLKARYQAKWRVSVLRELMVAQILNTLFLENGLGFTAVVVGLGAGLPDRLPAWWHEAASPLAAFDIAVYGPRGLAALIDVTGVRSYQSMRSLGANSENLYCVGLWKIWKAEELEERLKTRILERLWFVHVTDATVALRWLPAAKAKGRKVTLVEGERPYTCIPRREWPDTRAFIKWLKSLEVG